MRVEWGVIPVAGRGSRMHPLSRAVPKELLPLGRVPVVQHVVDELVAAGIRDLVFVTSPDKPTMRSFLSDADYWRQQLAARVDHAIRFHIVEQIKQIGLGDAVLQSERLVQDRPFVVALGDCVIGGQIFAGLTLRMLDQFHNANPAAVIALEEVAADEVHKYGIAQIEGSGESMRITDLVEKPEPGSIPSRWAIAGRYVFDPRIFHYLKRTERGRSGEIQLTDSIREMIRTNNKVQATPLLPNEKRFDVGEFEPYFKAFADFAANDSDTTRSSARHARPRDPENSQPIVGRAFARAGLLGNPSDGYGGKTISIILQNWNAEVRLTPSRRLSFQAGAGELLEFDSVTDFVSAVRRNGYYGGLRLVQATVKRFYDFCRKQLPPTNPCFSISYQSNIPRQLGLGGSSAIVIATLRALSKFHDLSIPNEILPSLALSVETDELSIPAGLQDRVIQTFEGLMYMDFSTERRVVRDGLSLGHYERMDERLLPKLYVATLESAAEPTEIIHGDLRKRYERGDKDVIGAIAKFAQLAEKGRQAILDQDEKQLSDLMNANFELRRSICKILPEHERMVEIARSVGASAKFCGSGGAIVGIYGDESVFDRLAKAMKTLGATVVRPTVGTVHTAS